MESGKEDKLPMAISSTCRFGSLPKKSSSNDALFPPIPSTCRFDRLLGKLDVEDNFFGLISNVCKLFGELVSENEFLSHMYIFFILGQ